MDKVEALLWWHGVNKTNGNGRVKFSQIKQEIENANHGELPRNAASLIIRKNGVVKDKNSGCYYLRTSRVNELSEAYSEFLAPTPRTSSSLLLEEDFKDTRRYVEAVIRQINVSYDEKLYDCCAIMIRRLIETLIIELFERKKVANEIKFDGGNYKMLKEILNTLNASQSVSISRKSQNIPKLEKFKENIADKSAHNRTFNAKKSDIDNVWEDLRAIILDLKAQAFD
ncbi:MAG: hypothetical protein GDA55_07835 [Cellvibrionales bacterium]|nr:hypothetical protein [Cellvibrionales bacterium]